MEQETAVRAQNMLDAIRGEERFEMFRAGVAARGFSLAESLTPGDCVDVLWIMDKVQGNLQSA